MPGDESRFTRDATTRRNDSTLPELVEAGISGQSAAVPPSARYVVGGLLGVGGMGEVRVCFDAHMSREVAMKVVRSDREVPQLEQRFLAEARLQAGMEHPGIVPVHDLGRDPHGHAFFTMKRVHGVALDVILDRRARGDAETLRDYPLHRLLTAFAQVCLTVDFAHGRGIAHRDLKPSNVMLGDHGEVYVLDWGIAKVRAGDEETMPSSSAVASRTLVGTLGYVAPELVGGARGDPTSDVFSLGAILFEILARQPLVADDVEAFRFLQHPGSIDRSPRRRAPALDLPAELDAAALEATEPERAHRFPTARALHEAIDAFLRGDRDLEARRRVAAEHLASAVAVLEKAGQGALHASQLAEGLRAAGKAVALDPDDPRASSVLLALLAAPSAEIPPEVEAQRVALSGERLRGAMPWWAFAAVPAAWAVVYPLVFLFDPVRDWREALLVPVTWALVAAVMFVDMRRSPNGRSGSGVSIVALLAAVASTSAMNGPLIIVPAMTVAVSIVTSLRPERRALPTLLGCAVLAGTAAIAYLGLHDPYHFEPGGAVTLRFAQRVTPLSLYAGSTVVHVVVLVLGTRFAARYRDALDAAETRMVLLTWRLANMLPAEVARQGGAR